MSLERDTPPNRPEQRDYETGLADSAHLDLRVWLRLLTCTTLIERQIKRGLRGDFETTLPRFDALAQLDRAGGTMTMRELSSHMMVTNGNITAIVDRLLEDGFVVRRADPKDRRVHKVQLTDAGREFLATMIPVHNAWVSEAMAQVDEQDLAHLYKLLGQLKNSALQRDEERDRESGR